MLGVTNLNIQKLSDSALYDLQSQIQKEIEMRHKLKDARNVLLSYATSNQIPLSELLTNPEFGIAPSEDVQKSPLDAVSEDSFYNAVLKSVRHILQDNPHASLSASHQSLDEKPAPPHLDQSIKADVPNKHISKLDQPTVLTPSKSTESFEPDPSKQVNTKKTKTSKVQPVYQNPENPDQTWTGRGKTPVWLRSLLETGRTLEEFFIGKSTKSSPKVPSELSHYEDKSQPQNTIPSSHDDNGENHLAVAKKFESFDVYED